MKTKKTILTILVCLIMVAVISSSICNGNIITANKNHVSKNISNLKNHKTSQATEYWALLVAVGVYYNNPEQNRESMLYAIDDLHSSLLNSPNWQADHIHTLKGSQATTLNLIRELIWLILNEDSDDYSLVYITTHGGPLTKNGAAWDMPPKDESDGDDEVLAMYYGFERYDHVTDDMLNFFFKLLKSKGLCVIIDSCFSGGFDDSIRSNNLIKSNELIPLARNLEIAKYKQGMVNELAAEGRIILMSCEEEELSYNSYFSNYLTEGFNGWADITGDFDGINSAEEAFDFAYPWVVFLTNGNSHPTISDQYPGEFLVTYR